MHVEGVSALRGCDVLAEDFATTCPDQKLWISRFAGTVRQRPTLANMLRSVGYTGRPEYFSMYACVYGMVRCTVRWLQDHEKELQEAQQAFQKKHGIECSPAQAVAIVIREGEANQQDFQA